MYRLQRARNARDSITGFRKFSGKSSQFAVVISVGTKLNVFSGRHFVCVPRLVFLSIRSKKKIVFFMIAIAVIDHSH